MNTAKQIVPSQTKKAETQSSYISKTTDDNGWVDYSPEDNAVWKQLFKRQVPLIKNRACCEFIEGLNKLNMSDDKIPQIPQINQKLKAITGWQVKPVPALIGFETFFELLANKQFPAATFIRRFEDIDYIKEPDIFHELFGHCPLLTNQAYADFSEHYGKLGLAANKAERAMLARLYWFTIEFGLVKSDNGLKIYGGGILSSKQESIYSLESDIPKRQPLNILDAFRTHYRIDQLQKNYFIIDSLADLQKITQVDLKLLIKQAQALGMKPSAYKPKENAAC